MNKEPTAPASDDDACSPSSLTPETDAFEASQHPSCRFPAVLEKMRKLEGERDEWRNDHDRVVREYQHRLMVIGTAVIEATSYPENAKAMASADTKTPTKVTTL